MDFLKGNPRTTRRVFFSLIELLKDNKDDLIQITNRSMRVSDVINGTIPSGPDVTLFKSPKTAILQHAEDIRRLKFSYDIKWYPGAEGITTLATLNDRTGQLALIPFKDISGAQIQIHLPFLIIIYCENVGVKLPTADPTHAILQQTTYLFDPVIETTIDDYLTRPSVRQFIELVQDLATQFYNCGMLVRDTYLTPAPQHIVKHYTYPVTLSNDSLLKHIDTT